MRLGDIARVRAKNAGPFWLTLDVFCRDAAGFDAVSKGLTAPAVAARFCVAESGLQRFDLPDLNVVKFSLPRPVVQGAIGDRDMHGAAFAELLAGMEI